MVKKKKKAKKGNLLKRLVRKKVKKPKTIKRRVSKNVKKSKKPAKKTMMKTSKSKEDKFGAGFEEVVMKCSSCGREFRIVKSSGFSTEGMLCQRCAAGGGMGFEGDNDF
jgi:predicted ATP-grasp superfamily ATP-dependent carboligase